VPVGDICKCATVNIYEPLYPVVELITISEGSDILTHGVLAPPRSTFSAVSGRKPDNFEIAKRGGCWWSGGAGGLGGPGSRAGAVMGSACLIKGGSSWTSNLFHLFGQEGAVTLLEFNED